MTQLSSVLNNKGHFVLPILEQNGLIARLGIGIPQSIVSLEYQRAFLISTSGMSTIFIDGDQSRVLWDIDCPAWNSITCLDEGIVALSTHENVYVWDIFKGEILFRIGGRARNLAYNSAEKILAFVIETPKSVIANSKEEIAVWDIMQRKMAKTPYELLLTAPEITDMAFSPDGKLFAVALGTYILLNDPAYMRKRRLSARGKDSVSFYTFYLKHLRFSLDNRYISASDSTGNVFVWDISKPPVIISEWPQDELPILSKSVKSQSAPLTAFDPDSRNLIVGGTNEVSYWDIAKGTKVKHFKMQEKETKVRCFGLSSSSSNNLMLVGTNETISLRNISSTRESSKMEIYTVSSSKIVYSPSGTYLASVSVRGLILWDLSINTVIWHKSLGFHRAEQIFRPSVAFSQDGKYIAVGDSEEITIYDIEGNQQTRLNAPNVEFLAFTPTGDIVTDGNHFDAKILEWNGKEKSWVLSERLHLYRGIFGQGHCLSLTNNGKYLCASHMQGVSLISMAKGKVERILKTNQPDCASFSVDGQYIAVATGYGGYRGLHIWNISGGGLLNPLNVQYVFGQQTDEIDCIAFSPNGLHFATGGDTLRLWSIKDRKEEKRFTDITSVSSVAFSPNGKYLASASDSIRIWRL